MLFTKFKELLELQMKLNLKRIRNWNENNYKHKSRKINIPFLNFWQIVYLIANNKRRLYTQCNVNKCSQCHAELWKGQRQYIPLQCLDWLKKIVAHRLWIKIWPLLTQATRRVFKTGQGFYLSHTDINGFYKFHRNWLSFWQEIVFVSLSVWTRHINIFSHIRVSALLQLRLTTEQLMYYWRNISLFL